MSLEEELAPRIAKLRKYLKELENLQIRYDRKKFLSDDLGQSAIERKLQLSLEAMIDISDRIIAFAELDKPEENDQRPMILEKANILPKELAESLKLAARFRNILVHNYTDLNQEKVFDHFQNDLGDLKFFLKYIAKYLRSID